VYLPAIMRFHRTLGLACFVGLIAGCAADSSGEGDEGESSESALNGSGPRGSTPAAGTTIDCDVLVAGGGTGGVAAALAATRLGIKTCVTEETDWVGGQLTAQGLNASDDSPGRMTDTVGATRSFLELRHMMRAAYGGRSNPGSCWVSKLCGEPKVALNALEKMMTPAIDRGLLRVFYNVRPVAAAVTNQKLTALTMERMSDRGRFTIRAEQTVDATELGDVIKLSGAAYRVGQESRADTNEADAPVQGCPTCIQSFTYDVVLEKRPPGERHVIPKPAGYGVQPWMKGFSHKRGNGPAQFPMFGDGSVWTYRRIVDGAAFGRTDLSVMNWSDGNDYPFGGIVDVPQAEMDTQLHRGRERALGYVYWLQTEADGHGYPYLKLRSDVLGTTTGVAKTPYIREGRRLRALETIKTEDISDYYVKNSKRAREWSDSGGIGFYPMDMHRNVGPSYAPAFPRGHSLPFQFPIGSLIPETMNGLVAGAKNLGTTHITNSAYRLHPIEWAVGEAAGTLAALSSNWNKEPRQAFAHEGNLRELQDHLLKGGAPLYWIDDVEPSDPKWRDIQFVAGTGIMGGPEASTLHFRPELTLTRAQACAALVRALGIAPVSPANASFSDVPKTHWAYSAIEALAAKRIVLGTGEGTFSPSGVVTATQMKAMIGRSMGDAAAAKAVPSPSDAGMSRGAAASALAAAYRIRLYLP
jgi:hypothetical protein